MVPFNRVSNVIYKVVLIRVVILETMPIVTPSSYVKPQAFVGIAKYPHIILVNITNIVSSTGPCQLKSTTPFPFCITG